MKVSYPAIFYEEKMGNYTVFFPDFQQVTCGDDLADAEFKGLFVPAYHHRKRRSAQNPEADAHRSPGHALHRLRRLGICTVFCQNDRSRHIAYYFSLSQIMNKALQIFSIWSAL